MSGSPTGGAGLAARREDAEPAGVTVDGTRGEGVLFRAGAVALVTRAVDALLAVFAAFPAVFLAAMTGLAADVGFASALVARRAFGFRSAMHAPYPREGRGRTYVPATFTLRDRTN
jgi:hypothetical protein